MSASVVIAVFCILNGILGYAHLSMYCDTRYAMVCNLKSQSAIERLRRIKKVEVSKASCFYFIVLHSLDDSQPPIG